MRVSLGTLELSDTEAVRVGKAVRGLTSRSNAPATREQARAWALGRVDVALGRKMGHAEVVEATLGPVVTRPVEPAPAEAVPGETPAFHVRVAGAVEGALALLRKRLDGANAEALAMEPALRDARRLLEDVAGLCGVLPDMEYLRSVPYPEAP